MDIRILNFKPYRQGSMLGFFSLGYGGIVVKDCRLMAGRDGKPPWIAYPSKQLEQDGQTKYIDQITMSNDDREHIRRAVVMQLRHRGDIEGEPQRQTRSQGTSSRGSDARAHEKGLDDYFPEADDGSDIPF
jgi:DNA-binding cell septation regulator SpoVG